MTYTYTKLHFTSPFSSSQESTESKKNYINSQGDVNEPVLVNLCFIPIRAFISFLQLHKVILMFSDRLCQFSLQLL